MKALLTFVLQPLLHLWLRMRLGWVESEIHSIQGRLAVAEMELEFLPQQMDAHKAIAGDLRTRLAATKWGL